MRNMPEGLIRKVEEEEEEEEEEKGRRRRRRMYLTTPFRCIVYVASNVGMIVSDALHMRRKEAVTRYCRDICMKRMRNTAKQGSQDSRPEVRTQKPHNTN
jgi:hypothetical protein